MKIIHASNANEALQKATDQINTLFSENLNTPILFMVSGGSALKILDGIDSQNITENLTLCVLDERYSKDELINNYLQILSTDFYEIARKKVCHFINTTIQKNERMDEIAERVETSLRKWVEDHPNGVIIATMGIGSDGHTAGIMPFPESAKLFQENFEDEKKWATYYVATGKNPYPLRITTTIPFLKLIDYAVVLVTGEEKKEALGKIMSDEGSIVLTPGRIIREMKNVVIYTDISV